MDTGKLIPTITSKEVIHDDVFGKKLIDYHLYQPELGYFFWLVFSGRNNLVILPLTKDNQVICLRQYRIAADEIVWELPGGSINTTDFEHTREKIAHSELLEETGYTGDIHILPEAHYFEPSSLTAKFYVASAKNCVYKQPPQYDKYEFAETCVLNWNTWLELVLNGEVKDSKSIVATLKLRSTIK